MRRHGMGVFSEGLTVEPGSIARSLATARAAARAADESHRSARVIAGTALAMPDPGPVAGRAVAEIRQRTGRETSIRSATEPGMVL